MFRAIQYYGSHFWLHHLFRVFANYYMCDNNLRLSIIMMIFSQRNIVIMIVMKIAGTSTILNVYYTTPKIC